MSFNYNLDFKNIDFRKHPELYDIGKGEQGVLLVEPYKSEILPFWKFKTEKDAKLSSRQIFKLFTRYKKENDFVGMDMARKFLQMGFTRARRYANHASGQKYRSNPQKEKDPKKQRQLRKEILPQAEDWASNEKAKAAAIFFKCYERAKNDPKYLRLKEKHLHFCKSR